MIKSVELPLVPPLYSTYHPLACGSAITVNNPTIKNWYYNRASVLRCSRRFLEGLTTPMINVCWGDTNHNPYIERIAIPRKYLQEHVHDVMQRMLDDGYYVYFTYVDDYYVKGKSWCGEKHFPHDGLICGYDERYKTYTVYAYDEKWLFRTFKISWQDFDKGRLSTIERLGEHGQIVAMKATDTKVKLDYKEICKFLKTHLDGSLEKYPMDPQKASAEEMPCAYGSAVHDYICLYLDKLADKSITHEFMDRRVLRLIWEHKRVMCDRFRAVEDALNLDHELSEKFESIVKKADNARLIYATYHMKQRDSLLPMIKKLLMTIKEEERPLIEAFIAKVENAISQKSPVSNSKEEKK